MKDSEYSGVIAVAVTNGLLVLAIWVWSWLLS